MSTLRNTDYRGKVKHAFENADQVPDEVSILNLLLSCRDMLMSGVTNQIGMDDVHNFVFFTLCPKLQTYDIVQNEKVAGVRYRRYVISKKGAQFLAFVDKLVHKNKAEKQEASPTVNNMTPPSKRRPSKKRAVANKTSGGGDK